MIAVSDAWKKKHEELILPETFVEISCTLTEIGVQELATASGTDEATFSDITAVTGTSGSENSTLYATFEPNLWLLDGTRNILSTEGPYTNSGYVSEIADGGSVTLSLPTVHTAAIPGVTITWSSKYGEYATDFTVTAKNGDTVVAETTITDNKSNKSIVYLDIANYDNVTVTVLKWSIPNHRSRIDHVYLGLDMVFTKKDIISYTHEQQGCMLSGELPKNSIEFSVDNSDNRWNPNNPTGMERYLSERQRLTVRYGMDIDGTTEWIKAGAFYLSEWRAPSNGLEASFVARDMLEYMLNTPYTGITSGKISEIIDSAIEIANLPTGAKVYHEIFPDKDFYVMSFTGEYSVAEVLQMCANALGCGLYQTSAGVLNILPINLYVSDYTIDKTKSYTWPEIELSKPLKEVEVAYYFNDGGKFILPVANTGETQTVDNPLIGSEDHAYYVANLVNNQLRLRQIITGEFRADPRLELFDYVTVDTKYGDMRVVISNIKYSYNGAFRGSYTGRTVGVEIGVG